MGVVDGNPGILSMWPVGHWHGQRFMAQTTPRCSVSLVVRVSCTRNMIELAGGLVPGRLLQMAAEIVRKHETKAFQQHAKPQRPSFLHSTAAAIWPIGGENHTLDSSTCSNRHKQQQTCRCPCGSVRSKPATLCTRSYPCVVSTMEGRLATSIWNPAGQLQM